MLYTQTIDAVCLAFGVDTRFIKISGEKLAEARVRAGLNQRKLAEAVGVTERNIGRWERGKPASIRIQFMSPLAVALKIPEAELTTRLAPEPDDENLGPIRMFEPHDEAIRRTVEMLASLEKTTPAESFRRAGERLGFDQGTQKELRNTGTDPRMKNAAKPMGPRGPDRK